MRRAASKARSAGSAAAISCRCRASLRSPSSTSGAQQGDRLDNLRHVEGRRMTVAEHFAAERPHLRPLPDDPFEVGLHLTCRVDTKSRVCVRQCFYSVPIRSRGHASRRAPFGRDRGGARRLAGRRPSRARGRQGRRNARARPLPRDPADQARRTLWCHGSSPGARRRPLHPPRTTASSSWRGAASVIATGRGR